MKAKKMVALGLVICLLCTLVGCGSKTEYYKNTEYKPQNANEVVYETKDKNLGWGKYQKEVSELGEGSIELQAATIALAKTKEAFDNNVCKLKERLDILESNYALGYTGDDGDIVTVKMDSAKLGLPVFAILNIHNPSFHSVVSTLGDLSISEVKNFTYSLGENGRYDMTVEVPEAKQNELKQYIAQNADTALYLKLGELTFSSVMIKEDMPADKITFNGLNFLGSTANEADYEFILKLTEYVFNNPSDGFFTMAFPTEVTEGVTYTIPYITPMDEAIIANINALYSDTSFTRNNVKNNITIRFNIDPEKENTFACLNRIYKLYEACEFDGGAYATISFTWPSGDGVTNHYVMFTKKDGKMVCTGYADKIADAVKDDKFISQYLE